MPCGVSPSRSTARRTSRPQVRPPGRVQGLMVIVEHEHVVAITHLTEIGCPILQRLRVEVDPRHRPKQRVQARHVERVLAGNQGEGEGAGCHELNPVADFVFRIPLFRGA